MQTKQHDISRRRLIVACRRGVLWLPVALLAFASPCLAQPEQELKALRTEVESIRESLQAIHNELREIKTLLRGRAVAPEPTNVLLTVDGHAFTGDPNAKLTLIEFSDYQCPFCARHVRETLPLLEQQYITTGKVKYVFRNFPLESIHPEAFRAAEAASCAGEQQKYWQMHDRLFANQSELGDLTAQARAAGLDLPRFEDCLTSNRHATAIRNDLADGAKAGVRGTPAFFLGITEPDGKPVRPVRVITGAHPFPVFKDAVESLLGAPK
jgi:protein-disulfide isomerase